MFIQQQNCCITGLTPAIDTDQCLSGLEKITRVRNIGDTGAQVFEIGIYGAIPVGEQDTAHGNLFFPRG